VIDPPWDYGSNYHPDGMRTQTPYPTMTLEQIKNLEIPAAADCILWLWTTKSFIYECPAILEAWGFQLRDMLTWRKTGRGGNIVLKTGRWFRGATEFCLLATKGDKARRKMKEPLFRRTPDCFDGIAREHSRKPEEFYELVEQLCPGAIRKLDYFSRERRDGWYWTGNDTQRFRAGESPRRRRRRDDGTA
jgi:N6-adenosine-specific RNA methylase IME4